MVLDDRVRGELLAELLSPGEHDLDGLLKQMGTGLLVTELQKLEKMKPDIAFRIANIMPRTRDELRAIYAKEKYTLQPEELDTIIELVKAHF